MIEAAPEIALRQFLTFAVADEEYAIEILRVREILAYASLTRVPRAPRWVSGVMNLRGTVVPIIDLRIKLDMEATAVTARTCIVIVDTAGTTLGVLAEEVKQVIDLTADGIEPPPSFGTKIDLAFLAGMGDLGDRFALILDIPGVITRFQSKETRRDPAQRAA